MASSLRRRLTLVVATLAALSALLGGCNDSHGPPESTPGNPKSPVNSQDSVAAPRGEVWQWAQGRSWDDPAISRYTKDFGKDHGSWGDDPTGHVKTQGFALNLDSAGRVKSVTVYNDEARLGLNEGYRAYQGKLPARLSWSLPATQVYGMLGDPVRIDGGFGLPVKWLYVRDGMRLQVEFMASGSGPPERLSPNAPLHSIEVAPD